jgi:hypothetical protein
MRKSIVLWVVSVAAAAGISAGVTAQQVQSNRVDQPRVFSGNDIGFRVEGQRRDMRSDPRTGRTAPVDLLTGQLVVNVNGQWVEAEFAGGKIRPLTN